MQQIASGRKLLQNVPKKTWYLDTGRMTGSPNLGKEKIAQLKYTPLQFLDDHGIVGYRTGTTAEFL
jgi:hypothetical protein